MRNYVACTTLEAEREIGLCHKFTTAFDKGQGRDRDNLVRLPWKLASLFFVMSFRHWCTFNLIVLVVFCVMKFSFVVLSVLHALRRCRCFNGNK